MKKEKVTLGSFLKSEREKRSLTVRGFARTVKVDHTTILRIEEKNVAEPSILRKIASVLNLDYNYLLVLNGIIEDQPEVREIARASNKMTAEQRSKMMNILRSSFPDFF